MSQLATLFVLHPNGEPEYRFWNHRDSSIAREEKTILLNAIFMEPSVEFRILYEGHPRWVYVGESFASPVEDVNPRATHLLHRRYFNDDDDDQESPRTAVTVHGPMVISFDPGDPPPLWPI